ncbi:MAG TPA: ATP-binding cassette domain-containing protein, partial [Deltaproteobacteria bacterium]|nr:ATP-binding cassette domain-containing protein [Deltaproteobacteria bacterium]
MHPLEAAPVVTITGAAYVYPHARALDGIDLEVREGSYTGIVGRNGSGKTTLAHLIAGILKPTSGSV